MYKSDVTSALADFDYVSVREESGKKIVSDISEKTAVVSLDPVFLKNKEEWESLIGERLEKSKYIFVYPTQKNSQLDSLVNKIHKETGYKVITTRPSIKYKNVIAMGPIEFLNYIRYAECVVTSSFHATAFSLIFQKPLFVVSHSSRGTRTSDLLKKAGLDDCIISKTNKNLNFNCDYENAQKLLNAYILESKNYIKSIFEKGK